MAGAPDEPPGEPPGDAPADALLPVALEALAREHGARPIAGCPGRSVLGAGARDVAPDRLVPPRTLVTRHRVAAARDEVWVAAVGGGGLISYARPDGTFVHTLNAPAGFARKLAALGIHP